MAEISFPVVDQPMSADQWKSVTLGVGDGILDEGGYPYRLTNLSNATNTATIAVASTSGKASAILKGHYHQIDADVTIDLPAVTSERIYYVVLEYDPLREDMPVQLKVVTSLSTSGGREYLHLWNVRRRPNELLTDSTRRMIRPRVAPVTVYASESDLPQPQKSLWGTLAVIHNGRDSNSQKIVMAMNANTSGDEAENQWFWKTIYDPSADDSTFEWADRPDTASYYSPSHGYNRAIGRRGNVRRFRGRVARVSGATFNTGSDYQVWSSDLPPADAPTRTQRFITAVGNSSATYAVVEVSMTGSVTAWVSAPTYWIGLDGIEWEVA